jgi:hypothetical protein
MSWAGKRSGSIDYLTKELARVLARAAVRTSHIVAVDTDTPSTVVCELVRRMYQLSVVLHPDDRPLELADGR